MFRIVFQIPQPVVRGSFQGVPLAGRTQRLRTSKSCYFQRFRRLIWVLLSTIFLRILSVCCFQRFFLFLGSTFSFFSPWALVTETQVRFSNGSKATPSDSCFQTLFPSSCRPWGGRLWQKWTFSRSHTVATKYLEDHVWEIIRKFSIIFPQQIF